MSIVKKVIKEIVSKFATNTKDTGLSEVQVALFTKHIENLTVHMKENTKDYQARRGLLAFVTKRKRLLIYLHNKSYERYQKIIKELKLKGV